MRVLVNEKRVRRNRQIAQYAFFITLALLILGLFITNAAPSNPIFFFAPLIVLPVALAATMYSVRMANLWLREPRPEEVLKQSLKGVGARNVLYHYYLPARHVFVSPEGVFSLTLRPQAGRFTINGSRWHRHGSIINRLLIFFRQDSVGSPHLDAQRDAQRVQEALDAAVPNSGVQVQPLILMTDPGAEFEVEDSPIPVLYADTKRKPNIKAYFKDLKRDETEHVSLTPEQIEVLERAIGVANEAEA